MTGAALRQQTEQDLDRLEPRALELASSAEVRVASLEGLLDQLDDKRQRLVSMPSIWPASILLPSKAT